MEQAPHPVGGIDYPRTFEEFDAWFAGEEACRGYLIRLRWPDGFACPHCGIVANAWTTSRGLLHCSSCQGQTSATAGTVLEGTRKPLRLWFLAMWFVTSQKHGASALGLQRVLGLRSYQTAWAWLHKLRRAMVRRGRDRLSGRVEVDETYIGAPETGVHGRQTETKALVAIAAEENGKGIGRIRMARIDDASASSLEPFLKSSVERGAVVHTDGWQGYAGVQKLGYVHEVTNVMRSGHPAHETMPRVHRVASLLKRWLLGTHHGAVSHQHLEYYLDEYTFRFNRRTSRARGLLFHRLVQQAVATGPNPYRTLVGAGSVLELE